VLRLCIPVGPQFAHTHVDAHVVAVDQKAIYYMCVGMWPGLRGACSK